MVLSRNRLRVLIAPDSFKHSLDAAAVASAIASGWTEVRPDDDVACRPMADGGEGTLDAFAAAVPDATTRYVDVTGPDGRPRRARWLLLPDGVAVVELAESSGIELMGQLDPTGATTYGLGEVLRDALAEPAAERVLVGLGGSASTDGGAGALVAMGARLLDRRGVDVPPEPLALASVVRVDLTRLPFPPSGGITCLTDVTAPLLGPAGAARQFGAQKGADDATIELLESAMARWARLLGGSDDLPGAGAAGGTAYGLVRGLGARIEPGSAALMDLVGLPAAIADADVLITGEGRYDTQSGQGKVVGSALDVAAAHDTRALVVCGRSELAPDPSVIELAALAGSAEESLRDPARWLRIAGSRAAGSVGGATQ